MLWIAGQKMSVAVADRTVGVDLNAVPQDAYQTVQTGSAVTVTGVWIEGNRVLASAVSALPGTR